MSWPIFVGGAKHSTVWESPADPVAGGVLVVDLQPPPSFVDTASGEQYQLGPATFVTPHPLTGQPDQAWECTVYMHTALLGDQAAAMAALQDAVTRWWFQTLGTHRSLSTPDKNGHVPPQTAYQAECEDCVLTMQFENVGARARWMTKHIETTGHKVTWRDTQGEGSGDGGNSAGAVHQGNEGV